MKNSYIYEKEKLRMHEIPMQEFQHESTKNSDIYMVQWHFKRQAFVISKQLPYLNSRNLIKEMEPKSLLDRQNAVQ